MCDFMENKKAVAVENAAEDTIDLLEIFRALYRRWVWIVFTADYIIFDTPPVGVVGDAAIVSSVCDGTLLVIENGVTKKKTLCQIAAELEKVDTNILGVVQNMVGSKKDSSYYGKGNYGYYYGNNQNKK